MASPAADITATHGTVTGLAATADPLVYTATFTADDGFTGTGSVSVTAASYTDAALNLGGAGTDSVTIDTDNPTVTVDIVDGALSDGDNSSVVTFTFSEAPVGFTAADITATHGTVTGLAATADPLVYTATFTADDGFTGTGSVSVTAASYTDAALNLGGAGTDSVTIDTDNPTVTVDIVDGALSDGDNSSVVTFTFSEAPVGFTAADITATHGTVTGLAATADPLVYTATFTADDGFTGTGSVSVTAASYTDAALNLGGAGTDSVTIDTDNPTVTVDIVDGALSDGDNSSVVTFTFSEAPVGFTAADITATHGTVTGLAATADPLVYTATFTADDGFTGTGSVSVTAASYTDAALNLGGAGTDSVTIDTDNPTVTVDIVDGALSDGDNSSVVTFTFSEAPVGFTAAGITATHGTVTGLAATADPLVYTATFTADDGFTGTGSVSVTAASYTDAALNLGGAGTDSVTIDTDNPTVTVDIVDGALSDGDNSSVVTFTFSEAPVGFTAAGITATHGTVTGLAATADPLVYTATFTADDGFTGTGSVSVTAASYTDAALNLGGAGTDSVTIDTDNPTVTVDIVDGALSDGDNSSVVTFTFSEAPVGFTAADITATHGTVTGLAATADPLVYTATFTADDGFTGTGSVSVTAASYTDAALNLGGAGTDSVTIDTDNPTVTVDIVDGALSDGDNSSVVTFTFSEAPVGFTAADITATHGTVTGLAATADPLVYTATFTADDGFTGTGSVSVTAASYTDAALNLGGAGTDSVTIDTDNPTVTVDIVDGALSDGDNSSVVTFTFSEAPVGFTAADITATHGTVTGLAATADPLVYTATFTADDGFTGTGSVSVTAASYTDAALNLGGAGTDSVTIDTDNPTVTVDIVDGALSDGDNSSVVTFTFSEAPVGFTAADITATHGSISGFTLDDATHYHATFTATDGFAGTGTVAVGTGYTDAAGNTGGAGSDTVTIDRANPTVAVDIIATSLSDTTSTSNVTFTFSEAVTGFDASDITPTNGTISGFTTIDSSHYSATFTATDGFTGTGTVAVGTGYTDAAANTGVAGSDTVTIDRANPTAAVNIVATSLSDTTSTSNVTFTFSEAVTGFDASDITPTNGTISGFTTIDSSHYSATFTATDGFAGTGTVAVGTGYTDAAANTGVAGSDTVTIDRANPTVAVNIVATSLSDTTSTSNVTFTFSEAVTGFDASDITPTNGTISGFTTIDSSHYSATFTATDGFAGTGTVAVGTGYIDAAANTGVAGSDTVAIDRANPTVSSEVITSATGIQSNWLNAGDVASITVTMSEAVTVTGTPHLALTIGGTTVQANYASGSGGSALVFTYTILGAQTDTNGIAINLNALSLNGGTITDAAGNAATLTAAAVTDNANFKVDTTAPTVAKTGFNNGQNRVSGTFSDSDSGVVTVNVSDTTGTTSSGNATLNTGAGTWTYTNASLQTNDSLTIIATDAAGNQTTLTTTAPAGIAGESMNLGLVAPSSDHIGTFSITVAGVPSGWILNEGTNNGDGTWTVQSSNIAALSVTSPSTYAGALVLDVATTWTNADGSTGHATVVDNVEAYAQGSPIFALSGDDFLTGSSGHDLFVFSQPIGHDVIYGFDATSDQIDLIGYTDFTGFGDIQAHMANDAAGNAVITLADGQSITLNGIDSSSLTASDFVFDQTPVTENAGHMVISDGAILPLSGIIDNTGTIELNSTGDETDLQLIEHGITLQGGGHVDLSDSSENVITGTVSDVTLTNVDNTISGAGHLGDGVMVLVNEGTIIATGTNTLDIDTGSNAVTNTGTLEATGAGGLEVHSDLINTGVLWANGGNVTIDGNVSGNGTAQIGGFATLEFGAASSANVALDAQATGTIVLHDAFDFSGVVSGFNGDDHLDLLDVAFGAGTTASYVANQAGTGGTLSVTDGVHTANITLLGQYDPAGFETEADKNMGTLISYHDHLA
ncbi:hypothetical protein ACVME8_000477 [Bradyrhizobium diazoefficiens]